MHVSRDREEQAATAPRAPEPVPPERAGALDWASAMGNQAVARLARQATETEELETEAPEAEAEAEEAPPPEVEQLESQGIGMEAMAGLDAVDDLAEGDLPE